MQKLKTLYAEKKDEFWELVRYVIAGALTTAVALLVSYGLYFLLAVGAAPEPQGEGVAAWVVAVINSATTVHVTVSNVITWIIAVIFAFWINRGMVFRVKYHDQKTRVKAFMQFVSARVVSLLLFELGLAALLSEVGTPNIIGRLIVLVLVIIFNYIASKFWIFRKDGPAETQP